MLDHLSVLLCALPTARHAAAMSQFINYALGFENVWFATMSEVGSAAGGGGSGGGVG